MEELLNELMETKELLERMTKEFLIKFSIAAKPETDLVSCLMALSKEELINIAFLHIEELDIDDDKEKIVNDLADIIKVDFVKDLAYFLASDLSFINDCILANSEPFEYKGDAVTNLSEYGYAFSFYYKEQFYGIMPKELVEIFLMVDKEALEKKVTLNEELMKYAYALTNLYGAYLSEQYVAVWNVHHKEKITCEFAEDFLERASLKQYVFWASGDLIASCTLEDEDEEYEYILEEAKTHGYYMPTKSDITFISENEYDESSIAFKKVRQYIEEKELSELITDNALFEIENSCLFDVKFKDLLADLVEMDVTFEGLEDIQAFADLYMHLSSDTRKWILGGNKPNQLFDSNNNPFNDFNNRERQIIPQKVGRNDPCPCGSGKKYKKCCMDS